MIHNNGFWPYRVEPGDVLLDDAGNFRTVLKATQDDESGFTTHVHLTIMRCSWTRRPYTVKTYCDLQRAGFQPTGKRVKIDGLLKRVQCDAMKDHLERELFSWDVVGVVR